jgi:hypothetical protein
MNKCSVTLRSSYVTDDGFYTHPEQVILELPVELVQNLKAGLEFMQVNKFFQLLIDDAHFSYDFEDGEGDAFEDYIEIEGCNLRLDRSGQIRFIFPLFDKLLPAANCNSPIGFG